MVFRTGIAALTIAIIGTVVTDTAAYADNRAPLNDAEANARNLCWNDPDTSYGPRGAIWFTNNAYYYSGSVNVSSNQQSVNVNIRGSIYGCLYGTANVNIYATNIKPAAPNAALLTLTGSNTLFRGRLPSPAQRNWSSQGGQVPATLNISSIPINTDTTPKIYYRYVGLYRCFQMQGFGQGNCYSETIEIRVVRAGAPGRNWSGTGSTTARLYDGTSTSVKGSTTGGTLVAYPNDTAAWSHRLQVTGFSGPGSRTISVSQRRSNAFSGTSTSSFNLSGNTIRNYTDAWLFGGLHYSKVFGVGDVDQTFCGYFTWTPAFEGTGSGSGSSNDSCVTVASNFNIYPTSSIAGSSYVTIPAGEVAPSAAHALNGGSAYAGFDTEATVYTFKFNANTPLPAFSEFTSVFGAYRYREIPSGTACGWLGTTYGAVGCAQTAQRSESWAGSTPNAGNLVDSTPVNADDYALGEKVCRITVVKNYNYATRDAGSTSLRLARPACALIAKRPIAQVWGNDVRTGSGLAITDNQASIIQGMPIAAGGFVKGSWAEYSAIASGNVTNFASGSRFVADTSSASDWNRLTFANQSTYGNFATPSGMGVLPDVGKYFSLYDGGDVTVVNGADITISSYAANTIYVATGTVTISDNLTAPGSYGAAGDIGQMVIIANGGIRIAESVATIDAWLSAPRGYIDTCYEKSGALTTGDCSQALTVNGPMIAETLRLRRTAGDKTAPAETANLRGDAYIWARARSEANGTYQTKHTTELPPRY